MNGGRKVQQLLGRIAALPCRVQRSAGQLFFQGVSGPVRPALVPILRQPQIALMSRELRELASDPRTTDSTFLTPLVARKLERYVSNRELGIDASMPGENAPIDLLRFLHPSNQLLANVVVATYAKYQKAILKCEKAWGKGRVEVGADDYRIRMGGHLEDGKFAWVLRGLSPARVIRFGQRYFPFRHLMQAAMKMKNVARGYLQQWGRIRQHYGLPFTTALMADVLTDVLWVEEGNRSESDLMELCALREPWYKELVRACYRHRGQPADHHGYVLCLARTLARISRKDALEGDFKREHIRDWEQGRRGMMHVGLRVAAFLYPNIRYSRLLGAYHATQTSHLGPYLQALEEFEGPAYVEQEATMLERLAKTPGTLGARILSGQLELGLTRAEMRMALGVTISVYPLIVANQQYPRPKIFQALSELFGEPAGRLLLLGLKTHFPIAWDAQTDAPKLRRYAEQPFWVTPGDAKKLARFAARPNSFAEHLFFARKAAGLTHVELATRTGLTRRRHDTLEMPTARVRPQEKVLVRGFIAEHNGRAAAAVAEGYR